MQECGIEEKRLCSYSDSRNIIDIDFGLKNFLSLNPISENLLACLQERLLHKLCLNFSHEKRKCSYMFKTYNVTNSELK